MYALIRVSNSRPSTLNSQLPAGAISDTQTRPPQTRGRGARQPVEAWGFSPSKTSRAKRATAAQPHPQHVFESRPQL